MTLFDPALRSQAPLATFTPHAGGVLSMDLKRSLLVTAGLLTGGAPPPSTTTTTSGLAAGSLGRGAYSGRHSMPPSAYVSSRAAVAAALTGGRAVADPLLRVFDLRMMRAQTPVSMPLHTSGAGGASLSRGAGPCYVRFRDAGSGSTPWGAGGVGGGVAMVACTDGRLFNVDLFGDGIVRYWCEVDPAVSAEARAARRPGAAAASGGGKFVLTSAALSPSGNCLSVCDSDGLVHVLAPGPGTLCSSMGFYSAEPIEIHGVDTEPWILPPQTEGDGRVADDATLHSAWDVEDSTVAVAAGGTSRATLVTTAERLAATAVSIGADGTGSVAAVAAPYYAPAPTAVSAGATSAFAAAVSARAASRAGGGGGALQPMPAQATGGRGASSSYSQVSAAATASGFAAPNPAVLTSTFLAAADALCTAAATPGVSGGPPPSAVDRSLDALLLRGAGFDVPVDAPGFASCAPPPHADVPWDAVFSVSLAAVKARTKADIWHADGAAAAIWASESGKGGRGGAYAASGGGARTGPRTPAMSAAIAAIRAAGGGGAVFAPSHDRASTFPDDVNDTLLLPRLRCEIDPALLAHVDPTGSYINNRMVQLKLRPNGMLYGRRKAYVDPDPRHRAAGRSALGLSGGPGGSRDRSGSMSSSGSGSDGGGLFGGDGDGSDDDDTTGGSESEGEEIARLLSGGGPGSGSASLQPVPPRPTRAYRRPVVEVGRFGVWDVDMALHNRTLYAGLQRAGANSWVAAIVHVLFFAAPLRARVQRHLCQSPWCATCELRFLFDTLAQVRW